VDGDETAHRGDVDVEECFADACRLDRVIGDEMLRAINGHELGDNGSLVKGTDACQVRPDLLDDGLDCDEVLDVEFDGTVYAHRVLPVVGAFT